VIGFGASPSGPQCSRAGCREAAAWTVNWRNPRIHDADRVKAWLACDEHRDFLYDFVEARGFPVAITPFGVALERLPDPEGAE